MGSFRKVHDREAVNAHSKAREELESEKKMTEELNG